MYYFSDFWISISQTSTDDKKIERSNTTILDHFIRFPFYPD